MFNYDKKSIYISIIMSAIIICSCIRPANSGTFTRLDGSYSISDGTEDMSAKEIIRALKSGIRQNAVQREEKNNLLYLFVSIAEIFIIPFLIYRIVIYFRYRRSIKLWRVISYIHGLDGKKGGIIFCMD